MQKLSPYASASETRKVLERHGLATKHALGQNFLVNDAILQKIVALAELDETDDVLEIGPGIGTLTVALLQCARSVVSIEFDPDLPAVLAETTSPWAHKFALIENDALKVKQGDIARAFACVISESRNEKGLRSEAPQPSLHPFSSCFPETQKVVYEQNKGGLHPEASQPSLRPSLSCSNAEVRECAGDQGKEELRSEALQPSLRSLLPCSEALELQQRCFPNKLVANLPYAVAATVVLDYFQRFEALESMTVMVQREVADRMCAQPGVKDYGAFTVKLSLYAQPAGRFPVGPNNFFPPQRVDSAVIRLNRQNPCDRQGNPLTCEEVSAACIMADAAFATRRKTLANSCKTFFSARGEQGKSMVAKLPQLFERAGVDARRRGETLSREEFVALARAYLALCEE